MNDTAWLGAAIGTGLGWAEALGASRRTRACLVVLVLLVLAAGGGASAAPSREAAVAAACSEAASSVREHPRAPAAVRRQPAAARLRAQPTRLGLPRWRDLRSGGLPAPRAPDAG